MSTTTSIGVTTQLKSLSDTQKRAATPSIPEHLRAAARAVHAYVALNDLTDLNTEEWEQGFTNDKNPGVEIFWWECWTLATLLSTFELEGPCLARTGDRVLKFPSFSVLRERHVYATYAGIGLPLRRRLAKVLFAVMNGVVIDDGLASEQEVNVCFDALGRVAAIADRNAGISGRSHLVRVQGACCTCGRVAEGGFRDCHDCREGTTSGSSSD